MKSLLLLSTLAIASTVSGKFSFATLLTKQKLQDQPSEADLAFEAKVKSNFAIMKGLIDGYYEGMYKNASYTTQKECLADDSVSSMLIIKKSYDLGNFNLTNVVVPVHQLAYNFIKFCEFDDALYDMYMWCSKNDCSLATSGNTLLKKIFQVTTVANDVAQNLNGPKPDVNDYAAITEFWRKFALSIGKLSRYATGFDYNQLK
ncbi:UNKNOWN [Stylonychia lemnae]|uniref:Uncharacterized protein n=1 Tax=Stylonychia lemnae TaxID=5949 RepID=A0A078A082_STYLE|nr:UNKNOWN [Stylonychia lemnae]|eukprot:CDW75292.1 UNKNOWN [Stylonychia lemnae]